MKKIEAQIQSAKTNEVMAALAEIGIDGVIIASADGGALQKRAGVYRGREFPVAGNAEVRLELAVADGRADAGVAAIVKAAGGVRLTITDLEEAGCRRECTGIYRGREYAVEFVDEDRIEMTVVEGHAGDPMVAIVMEGDAVKVTVGGAAGFGQAKPHAGIYRGIAW